ncbi:class I SAM-dependent rRNA methyltransferase [Geobacter sp. SVR]|uniref:class I SAM-dependent rRNA methyltransferase n=1 Tax=Geobacter sp. SVR TaxID=2495594 RepID=UPI00143EF865|nr:class I SAM-dependent rRNA methyltransferase [Geobacter sp. SVR]BCS52753.1 SAM-dependent methyltransferase [Geobacter sp. SVR]GCF86751.1 SAM-dependent methyltransferase [Geobacter sp. SVR]
MLKITLKKNEDKRIKFGHPWVFSNEIATLDGPREAGAAAELFDAGGGLIGSGYYNPRSLIAFRLLSRQREDIDTAGFYRQRIAAALEHRRGVYPGLATFRAVYGESDFLPGLVVDKYGDYLSLQILSAGMERRRDLLLEALAEVFAPKGIIARNDVSVRSLEGLPETIEVLAGEIPELVEMEENGLRFLVDLRHGQKTGGFLDQKENHLLLRGLCKGKQVLDCFCYAGSWATHAGAFGAASVLGIDISARAVAQAERNAELNGLSGSVSFEECDAFERLRSLHQQGRRFGVVVMDPPAFVKSRKNIAEATKGYLTVNRRALELLEPGGYLITCSCSHHMGREAFRDVLTQAARQARREVRLVEARSQAADHPVLLSFPESEYLKCLVLQAV